VDASSVEPGAIREQLERVLSSAGFRRAERSGALLRFIVEQTVEGRADRLKEYTLGAEALDRGRTRWSEPRPPGCELGSGSTTTR
jgi:hypothetical protein